MSEPVPLQLDDVHELTRLHMACFPLDQVWSAQSFQDLLGDAGLLGWRIEQGGRNVAFILGRLVVDEVELLTLAVSSRARRQGLAQQLMDKLIATARERHALKIFLEVAENNDPAIQLYAKSGFKAISRRWNYYPGGLSAHVLQLDLTAAQ